MVAILRHGQHIETLLSLVAALLERHQLLQQRLSLRKLTLGESLLGILVSGIVVAILVHRVEFRRAAAQQQGCKRHDNSFLHIGVQSYTYFYIPPNKLRNIW